MSILYEERLDGALPDVDRTSVLMALREHVPGLEILHTDEEIIPYQCDRLSTIMARILLVVIA
ncbi:hypothetical protein ACLK1S_18450 [Escherichia coli]